MAIAKGTITLSNLTDSLTVLISPSSCIISTDADGSNPDFTNAYADVTVARGNTLVEFTLTFASASSQGIGYSITDTDNYHKRIAITALPNNVTSGLLSFNLVTQDGYSAAVHFQFTTIPAASSGNQVQSDWKQDDSSEPDFIKNKPTDLGDFSNNAGYIKIADLPIASASTLGCIKVGTNLSINASGVLSAVDTTYDDFAGRDHGLVPPIREEADHKKFLRGDGTWQIISFHQVQSDWNQTNTSSADYIKNKPTIPTVPTNVSSFTNDAGYITIADLTTYTAGNGINISSNNYISVKINSNGANGLGVGGDGISLTVVTPSVSGVGGTNGAMLATDKEKLDGISAGAEANVQSDWNQTETTADDYIKNKPTIPVVPTNVSAFTNDAGYITAADLPSPYTLPIASSTTLGGIKVGAGLTISSGGVLSATGGGVADSVAWGNITGTLADQTDLANALSAKYDASNPNGYTSNVGTVTSVNNTSPDANGNVTLVIPAAQIQSDWSQTDTTALDFIKNKPTIPTVPTNVSAFTNDAGYITTQYTLPIASASVLGGIMVGAGLTISSGGVLSATGGGVADSVAWGNITGTLADQTDLNTALGLKANTADLATVAFSGSYNDLTNTPTIPTVPTNVSAFTNDAGYLTSADLPSPYSLPTASTSVLGGVKIDGTTITIDTNGVISAVVGGSGTVTSVGLTVPTGLAVSGSPITSSGTLAITFASGYSIPLTADVDKGVTAYGWGDHSQAGYLTSVGTLNTNNATSLSVSSSESFGGSISLHKVSKTGSYNDLLNKPTIPVVNDATLTIQKNSVTIDTFTANSSTDKTINITVPIKTSELTNDSGFISSLPIASANHLGCIKVGSNLTITAEGVLSANVTTYQDFTGATASTDGAHGLVPQPNAGDEEKFLRGDGTWFGVFTAGSDTTPSVPGKNGLVPWPTFGQIANYLRGDGTWTKPTGNLYTNETSSLVVPQFESFDNDIHLHCISKTGKFTDLNERPFVSKTVSYDPSGAVLAGWRPVCKLQIRGIYLMFMEGGVSGSNAATHAAIAIDIDFAHATIKQMWGNKVWDVPKVRLRRLSENGSDRYDWMVGFFHDETDSSPAYINFSIIGLGNEPADAGYDGGTTGFDPYDDSLTQSNLVKEISLREMVDLPGLIVELESNSEALFDSGKDTKKIGVEGTLPISHGGTGANTAAGAISNLLAGSVIYKVLTSVDTTDWVPYNQNDTPGYIDTSQCILSGNGFVDLGDYAAGDKLDMSVRLTVSNHENAIKQVLFCVCLCKLVKKEDQVEEVEITQLASTMISLTRNDHYMSATLDFAHSVTSQNVEEEHYIKIRAAEINGGTVRFHNCVEDAGYNKYYHASSYKYTVWRQV